MFRLCVILVCLVLSVTNAASFQNKNQVHRVQPARYNSRNPALVTSTTSNPKNDVEVIGPLEGSQPPAFPPPVPDYPPSLYPYEPPFYPDPNESPYGPPYGPAYIPDPAYPRPPYNPYYPPMPPGAPDIPETTEEPQITTRYTEPTTRYTEPTTPPTPRTTKSYRFTTKATPKFTSKPFTLKPYTVKFTAKRALNEPVTPVYKYNPYTRPTASPYPTYTPRPTIDSRVYFPWITKRPASVPPPIYPHLTSPLPQYHKSNFPYSEKFLNSPWNTGPMPAQKAGTVSPVDSKYKWAMISNYENYDETSGTFGFNIDLENGLAVHIRGYRKNGKQILDGYFILFTSEGKPVKITYTADNDESTLLQNQPSTSVPATSKKVEIESFSDISEMEQTTTEWRNK